MRRLPRAGDHPVVVLTINVLIPRLSAVTVAVVTGTEGPAQTHIPIDSESGLTSCDVSYVNATDLHSVDKSRLRQRRGRLHPGELGTPPDLRSRWSAALDPEPLIAR